MKIYKNVVSLIQNIDFLMDSLAPDINCPCRNYTTSLKPEKYEPSIKDAIWPFVRVITLPVSAQTLCNYLLLSYICLDVFIDFSFMP